MKPIVLIESPYAGDIAANLTYVRRALHDSIMRGEVPFASHALYTQEGVLDDNNPEERKLGMEAGWELLRVVDYVVVYEDRGRSRGMDLGIERALSQGKRVVYRSIEI